MERVLEPELMEDDEQARAYAEADFEDAHSRLIAAFGEAFPNDRIDGFVLDMGCGPGDIAYRFAAAYPDCVVHGVDGSEAMLRYGDIVIAPRYDAGDRVTLIQGLFPNPTLPRDRYEVIISNSLLHHLPDAQVLWDSVRRFAAAGAPIFIMDLMRPASPEIARQLVETYSSDEPDVLQEDFYASLLAAFEPDEVEVQLQEAGLEHLEIREVSDRHLVIAGYAP